MLFTGGGPLSTLKLSQSSSRWNRAKYEIIITPVEFDTLLRIASRGVCEGGLISDESTQKEGWSEEQKEKEETTKDTEIYTTKHKTQ